MNKQVERNTAFAFGVVFVTVLLALALLVPTPTSFQYMVFRIVLSLAAAGVAAMVPGFLEITVPGWIRAGGALGVFVVVYFYNPATLVADHPFVPEAENPAARSEVEAFLRKAVESSSHTDVERELDFYAERVDYFNKGIVGRSTIEQDRRAFVARWPNRKYWLEKIFELRVWNNGSEFEATLLVGYSVENDTKKREARTVTQQVRARREGDAFKITYIREL